MGNWKAIETEYKGYRFRSRLEARWAVFFDALGIQWEYEKEGYDLDGVRYLPDFWLPTFDGGMWAEVKPDRGDYYKSELLCMATHRPVWKCEGNPAYKPYYIIQQDVEYDDDGTLVRYLPTFHEYDGLPNWNQAEGENRMYSHIGVDGAEFFREYPEKEFGGNVLHAANVALSARFEHGEVPATINRSKLVGKYFHSYKPDGSVHWQGRVVSESGSDVFTVQLCSWLDGNPTIQKIINVKDMVGWSFYESSELWNSAADALIKQVFSAVTQ